MPFTRMQEAAALATSIDTAMNRRDEIGMDMLRDLLPEIREIIDAVNAALREVDELLFTGLRDEAIGLNDPEFATVAARLHLEDKAAWPEAQAFFESEGIAMPPKLDFETLAALESAHAEAESLARPLDRLRRLVLERAPILTRLEVLRKLRDADGTKPVWAEAVADHERARLAELPDIVRRALAAKDAAAIADLHAELVDPDWSVTVPKDLVQSTRGADVWARLRDVVPAAETAAAALAAGLPAGGDAVDPSAVATMRQARQEWYEASGAVQECLAALATCPTVAALARGDELDSRFAALAPQVQPALAWLEGVDADEAAWARHAQAISQLESYAAHPPSSARDEQAWLAGVGHLERQVGTSIPDDLRGRIADAVASVRRRPGRRLAVKAGIGVAAAVALLGVALLARAWTAGKQARAAVVEMLEDRLAAASVGAHDAVPEDVRAAAASYPNDPDVQSLVADIESAVERETNRRSTVRDALDSQKALLDRAEQELDRRAQDGAGLEPWPKDLVSAAQEWRKARASGGRPGDREPRRPTPSIADSKVRKVVDDVHGAEETRIDEAQDRQKALERKYTKQSRDAFDLALQKITTRLDSVSAAPDANAREQILGDIKTLREVATSPKVADAGALLEAGEEAFVSPVKVRQLDPLEERATERRDPARSAPDGAGGDP